MLIVQHVCNLTSEMPINMRVQNRQIKFLTGSCHVDNVVLRYFFDVMDTALKDDE